MENRAINPITSCQKPHLPKSSNVEKADCLQFNPLLEFPQEVIGIRVLLRKV